MSRIQQVITTLEAERADVQKRLAWIEKQINEFRTHHGGDAAASTTPGRRRATRRAASRAATSAPATTARRPRAGTRPRSQGGDVRSQIVAYLQQHPSSTASDIASATGLKRNTVSTRLTQMAQTGEIKKQARGYAAK
jgi:predicted Rossmann fold nucleotide-binding protein DprA/Smf involved in DNA uptake